MVEVQRVISTGQVWKWVDGSHDPRARFVVTGIYNDGWCSLHHIDENDMSVSYSSYNVKQLNDARRWQFISEKPNPAPGQLWTYARTGSYYVIIGVDKSKNCISARYTDKEGVLQVFYNQLLTNLSRFGSGWRFVAFVEHLAYIPPRKGTPLNDVIKQIYGENAVNTQAVKVEFLGERHGGEDTMFEKMNLTNLKFKTPSQASIAARSAEIAKMLGYSPEFQGDKLVFMKPGKMVGEVEVTPVTLIEMFKKAIETDSNLSRRSQIIEFVITTGLLESGSFNVKE